jgi:cold shock protein
MLKAIRKFVLERGRDIRQRPQEVVEEHAPGDPPGNSDVVLDVARPQSEEPSEMPAEQPSEMSAGQPSEMPADQPSEVPVRGKVKWFNPAKRFGFVELSDGSGDVFLHTSVLSQFGVSTVQSGETLDMRVAPGERGLVVTEVIGVDSSTAVVLNRSRTSFPSPYDRPVSEPIVQETGTVKWYNAAKGFGFIARDGGGKDVFVHASALERAGIMGLNEGQRVVVGIVEGRKGPEAGSIRVT